MKILYVLPVIILSLSGCATPTTGAVPQGDDMFTVTHQGSSILISTNDLKGAAMKEAYAYCISEGKKYKFIHSKEIRAAAGVYPESEVLFKCE